MSQVTYLFEDCLDCSGRSALLGCHAGFQNKRGSAACATGLSMDYTRLQPLKHAVSCTSDTVAVIHTGMHTSVSACVLSFMHRLMHTCNVPQLPSSLRTCTYTYTHLCIDTFMYAYILFILDSYYIDTFMCAYILFILDSYTRLQHTQTYIQLCTHPYLYACIAACIDSCIHANMHRHIPSHIHRYINVCMHTFHLRSMSLFLS